MNMKAINRTFILMAMFIASSCTSDDEPTDITGRYGNLTGESDTVITIGKTSEEYSFQCSYEEFPKTRTDNYYTWSGTFQNTPTDVVRDSQGKKIGSISIGSDHVTFTATTKRPGTYKAYRDEMTDLPRNH